MGLLTRISHCTGIKQANEAARDLTKCNKKLCNRTVSRMQIKKIHNQCRFENVPVLGRRLGEMTSRGPFQIKSVYNLKLQMMLFNSLSHQKNPKLILRRCPIPYPNWKSLDSQAVTQHRPSSWSPWRNHYLPAVTSSLGCEFLTYLE